MDFTRLFYSSLERHYLFIFLLTLEFTLLRTVHNRHITVNAPLELLFIRCPAVAPTITLHLFWIIVHVFSLEETRVPEGNLCRHGENMQTTHRGTGNRSQDLLAMKPEHKLLCYCVGHYCSLIQFFFYLWAFLYLSPLQKVKCVFY